MALLVNCSPIRSQIIHSIFLQNHVPLDKEAMEKPSLLITPVILTFGDDKIIDSSRLQAIEPRGIRYQ
jgi:hypothetical protein